MMWALPAGVFALLALLVAIAPGPPGRWFDRVLHLFGIGGVSARASALSLWTASALASLLAGYLIDRYTHAETSIVIADGFAIGVASGLALLWLASRKTTRGTGLMD